ncbi:MAG: (2Fe-2S) ferredoxin domain-containing protein [Magnetovibrio sp.]|nr:(2Fe-2S) ferredoxin domain-containing protein [Magnetovibrio sp.]
MARGSAQIKIMIRKREIFICANRRAGGAGCISQGSIDVLAKLIQRARERGDHVTITKNVCMGYCGEGPNVKIRGGAYFHHVTVDDVEDIFEKEQAFHAQNQDE